MEQDPFSTDGLAAPIYSLVGNLNYAKMLQDITSYKMRMEQRVALKTIKNAMEVYKEFDKNHLTDQILLLSLFMKMQFDPDNRTEQEYINLCFDLIENINHIMYSYCLIIQNLNTTS